MTDGQILSIVLLATHLPVAALAIFKTVKAQVLTKNQKRVNIFLILLLPFIWSVLIYFILKKETTSHQSRKKNKQVN
jgi:magnesium-transporting ATPase (P-type)